MKAMKLLVAVIMLSISVISNAEPKIFVREYTYQASESDSKLSARSCALSAVKGLLVEELGVYIESYVNYNVEDDGLKVSKDFYTNEIRQLSMGVAETRIIDEQWNGSIYYVKAEITVDPSDVVRRINKSIEDRKNDVSVDSLQAELEMSKEHIIELEEKIKELAESKAVEKELQMQYDEIKAKIDKYVEKINARAELALSFPIGARLSDIEEILGVPDEVGPQLSFAKRGLHETRKYGNVWLLFEGEVLYYAVGIESFRGDWYIGWYPERGVRNLLKGSEYNVGGVWQNEKAGTLQSQSLQVGHSLEDVEGGIYDYLEHNAVITNLALRLPIGTTKDNVIKFLGEPEADNSNNVNIEEDGGSEGVRLKYGNVWLCFSDGILMYAVSVNDYSPYNSIQTYKIRHIKNLLHSANN